MVMRERIRLILFNRNVWMVALAYACYMCIFRSLLAWLPTYLTEKKYTCLHCKLDSGRTFNPNRGWKYVHRSLVDRRRIQK
ncbi:hypothetical protein KEJ19_00170 [Candidatus Bathyarchaeota archaeon]|nr:hypothetical protein [Candidatus Bathyarchaeota archaeon]